MHWRLLSVDSETKGAVTASFEVGSWQVMGYERGRDRD